MPRSRDGTCASLGVAVTAGRQIHDERHDVRGPHAERDRAQPFEGTQQQARADEQHERKRDLADDERTARARLTAASAGGAAGFAQRALEIRARHLDRRREAEADSRDQRHTDAEGKDRFLERAAGGVSDAVGRCGQQHTSHGGYQ